MNSFLLNSLPACCKSIEGCPKLHASLPKFLSFVLLLDDSKQVHMGTRRVHALKAWPFPTRSGCCSALLQGVWTSMVCHIAIAKVYHAKIVVHSLTQACRWLKRAGCTSLCSMSQLMHAKDQLSGPAGCGIALLPVHQPCGRIICLAQAGLCKTHATDNRL